MRKSTNEIIRSLASRLEPIAPAPALRSFTTRVGLALAAIAAFSAAVLPLRPDWRQATRAPHFAIETSAWFMATFLWGALVYRSAIPALLGKRARWLGIGSGVVLFSAVTIRLLLEGPGSTLRQELDLYRGRCGPLILMIGSLGIVPLVLWARGEFAAPTSPRRTGLLIALASGGLGGLAMQFVCSHDEGLHNILWHWVPIGVLAAAVAGSSPRILRWKTEKVRKSV